MKPKACNGLDNPKTPEDFVAVEIFFMYGKYINFLDGIFVFSHSSTKVVTDIFLDSVEDCNNPRMVVKLPDTVEEL